jgi:alpha-glucosidase (family GH31 glycosyl hydrolase)
MKALISAVLTSILFINASDISYAAAGILFNEEFDNLDQFQQKWAITLAPNDQYMLRDDSPAPCPWGECAGEGNQKNLWFNQQNGAVASNIQKNFSQLMTNAVITYQFYDNNLSTNSLDQVVTAATSDPNDELRIWVGVKSSTFPDHYILKIDQAPEQTLLPRMAGWHTISIFVTSEGSYIRFNNTVFNQSQYTSQMTAFDELRIIAQTHTPGETGAARYDNLRIEEINQPNYSYPDYNGTVLEPSTGTTITQNNNVLSLTSTQYFFNFNLQTGAYSASKPNGQSIYSALSGSGILLNDAGQSGFQISSTNNNQAVVVNNNLELTFIPHEHWLSIGARILNGQAGSLKFRTAPASPAFGLGEQVRSQTLRVINYTNNKFQVGNVSETEIHGEGGRLQTPFLIFPQQGFAEALFYPFEKTLHANGSSITFGANKTNQLRNTLFYYFGTNSDIYQAYRQTREALGFHFKLPYYHAYGVGWETHGEYGCDTSQTKVLDALSQLAAIGVNPSWIAIGSGHWDSTNLSGCGSTTSDYESPTIDAFAWSPSRYPSPSNMISTVRSNYGVTDFLIGMRANFSPIGTNTFQAAQYNYLLTDITGLPARLVGVEPSHNVYFLNSFNPSARNWYISKIQSGYGNTTQINGFKEDEMIPSFQEAYVVYRDDAVMPIYKAWEEAGYRIVKARRDFFSVGTDLQTLPDGFISKVTPDPNYRLAKTLMASLTHTISGYPYPNPELSAELGLHAYTIDEDHYLRAYRGIQAMTFFPTVNLSWGIWHIPQDHPQQLRQKSVDFINEHLTIQPYLYDAVMHSYHTGEPTSVAPTWYYYPSTTTFNLDTDQQNTAQFFAGKSILVAPITLTGTSRQVYLPEGTWFDYWNNQKIMQAQSGMHTYNYSDNNKMATFVGNEGILVKKQNNTLTAYIYPTSQDPIQYTHYNTVGAVSSTLTSASRQLSAPIGVLANGSSHTFQVLPDDIVSFAIDDGTDYEIQYSTPPTTTPPTPTNTPPPQATPTPAPVIGDIDFDLDVDTLDYTILKHDFNRPDCAETICSTDLNRDSTVDILDYSILLSNFAANTIKIDQD